MKTQTIQKNSVRSEDLLDFKLSTIVGHLLWRYRFELVVLYAVSSTTWFFVTNFATAWQHFVK